MNSLGGFKLPVCWTCVLLFLGATWMPALSAQVVQGTITGNVSDSTGALVPGVDIIIKNEDTGVVTRTTSTSGGVYTVTLLPPGKYSITAELTGFQRLEIKGLELGSAQTVRQDLSLQIGSLVDSVTVESSAGLISTDTTSIQTALATKQLEALPVSLQNIDALLILAAGVGRATFQSAPQIAGSTHWGANNFTLNGVSVNDPGNGAGAYSAGLGGVNFPALSSLQEVNIAGINLDARYGRVVQVSMVTKNGTNQFHGDAYEYVQNDVLNATPFQVNAAGQNKPRFQRHQFGLDVGGPIFRNRTFFFFGYGGTRQNTPREVQLNLPTMAQRQGNFSALCATYNENGVCSAAGGTQLYNPFTGQPFLNNQIPSGLITTQAKTLLAFVPPPTDASSIGLPSGVPNYYTTVGTVFHVNRWDLRLDHKLNERDQIFGVYSSSVGLPWFAPQGTPPTYGNRENGGYKSFTVSTTYTHLFSSHTSNALRFGWFDHASIRSGQNTTFDPYSVFSQFQRSENRGVPNISMTGYAAIGDSGIDYYYPEYTVQWSNDFTHVVGKHTIMAGFDESGFKINPRGGALTGLGSWGFNGSWTGNQGWPSSFGRSPGSAVADFLLGVANSASGTPNGTTDFFNQDRVAYSRDWAFYVQDSWQASPRLTLNYGMRYVYQTPWKIRNDAVSYYNIKSNKILLPQDSPTPTAPPGTPASLLDIYPFETTQAAGIPKSYFIPDRNNFAPRVGVAWRPFGERTVFRAAYGIFYNFNAAFIGPTSNNIPYGSGFNYTSLRPSNPTTTYLPDLSFALPLPEASLASPAANVGVNYIDRRYINPRMQEWNVTIEHELAKNWSVRATYVGNHIDHLSFASFNINIPAVQQLGVPLQRQRPYQPWAGISSNIPENRSNTNQGQLEVKRRFSGGLLLQAQYQWTKALELAPALGGPQNPFDIEADYGHSSYLAKHTLAVNYVYELPFGHGRRWLKTGALAYIAGGWNVSGITSLLSGLPFSVSFQVPASQVGWIGGRADVVPGVDPYIRNKSHDRGALWFNPAAFEPPKPGTWGNSGRNILWGPGYHNWDMSVFKDVIMPFSESQRLQIRADLFDAFNHYNLNGGLQSGTSTPVAAVIGNPRDGGTVIPTTGQVLTGEGVRVVQLSLKYFF
jgi:hypothetical protein